MIQAKRKSGAMITVDFALEYGKDVYAIPGNIDSSLNEGTNILLKEGAKFVNNLQDILQDFT